MRYRIKNKQELTDKAVARNRVLNAVYDSRLARNPVTNLAKGVAPSDQKPV